jgi:hypothetical protein
MDQALPLLVAASIIGLLVFFFLMEMEQMRKRHHIEIVELIKLIKAGSLSEYEVGQMPLPKTENYIYTAMQNANRRGGEDTD